MPRRSLSDKISDVFKIACRVKRFEVAEHLLKALEAADGEPRLNSALGEAYFFIDQTRLHDPRQSAARRNTHG